MNLSLIESRLFGRICYGYRRDKQGLVEIVPDEAEVIKAIFNLYKAGNSLEAIQSYLHSHSIPSPSGKTVWSRDVINKLLKTMVSHSRDFSRELAAFSLRRYIWYNVYIAFYQYRTAVL